MDQLETIEIVCGTVLLTVLIWMAFKIIGLVQVGRHSIATAEAAQWRAKRGQIAETEAKTLLHELGFKIIERHPKATVGWWIDGEWTETTVTGDYIVSKDGCRALVEVKTGRESRPTHRHTRRQLFEYHSVFDVDQVYLLNADENRLYEIEFEEQQNAQKNQYRARFTLILAAFLSFFAGYFLSH